MKFRHEWSLHNTPNTEYRHCSGDFTVVKCSEGLTITWRDCRFFSAVCIEVVVKIQSVAGFDNYIYSFHHIYNCSSCSSSSKSSSVKHIRKAYRVVPFSSPLIRCSQWH